LPPNAISRLLEMAQAERIAGGVLGLYARRKRKRHRFRIA
jgi:hypothetical protein